MLGYFHLTQTMDLSTIQSSSNWGSEATNVNDNFQKVGTEVDKLRGITEGLSSGQVTLGSKNNLTELNAVTSPAKGDRYIVLDQINPDNNLPYYFVWSGTAWVNTGETIINADAVTSSELADYAKTETTEGIVVRTADGTVPEVDTTLFARQSDMDLLIEKAGKSVTYNASNTTSTANEYYSSSNTILTSSNWTRFAPVRVQGDVLVHYEGGLYGNTAGIVVTDVNDNMLQFFSGGLNTFKNTVDFTSHPDAYWIKAGVLKVNTWGTPLTFKLTTTVQEDTVLVVTKTEFEPVAEQAAQVDSIQDTIDTKLVITGITGEQIIYNDTDLTWTDNSYYNSSGNTGASANWRRVSSPLAILPNANVTLEGGWLSTTAGCAIKNSSGVVVQFITSGITSGDPVEKLEFVSHPDADTILICSMKQPRVFPFYANINTGRAEKYFVTPIPYFDVLVKVLLQGSDYTYIGLAKPDMDMPTAPSANDAYFCVESGSFWGLSDVISGSLVYWDGTAWNVIQFPFSSGGSGGEIPEDADYDVVILGGGAGGVSAAYALKDSGLKVALIEQDATLGGTHLNAWINIYATTPPPPFLQGVVSDLMTNGYARYVNGSYEEFTSDELANITYENTYLREEFTGIPEANITLDVEGTANKYKSDLQGTIALLMEATLTSATSENGYVRSVTYTKGGTSTTITGKYFIDASANDVLLDLVGGTRLQGEDAMNEFQAEYGFTEAHGTTNSSTVCNCPTMMYRITEGTEDLSGIVAAFANDAGPYYSPDKTLIYINSVAYLLNTGYEVILNGEAATRANMDPKTLQHWKTIKNGGSSRFADLDFPNKKYDSAAPKLGIRETYRAKTERLLNENHLYTRVSSTNIKEGGNLDKKIAVGNHIFDIHGTNNVSSVNQTYINANRKPYGVPYGALIPKDVKNLFVASRGAGMTHVAAASFRLIKDVMQLGWAAGHAAKICVNSKLINTRAVDVDILQNENNTDFINTVTHLEGLMS